VNFEGKRGVRAREKQKKVNIIKIYNTGEETRGKNNLLWGKQGRRKGKPRFKTE